MIRYYIEESELRRKIDEEDKNWSARTKKIDARCKKAKKFVGQSDWSSIKPVYFRLQHEKCCYCERALESEPFGLGEQDVEHFRPKSAVKDWLDESSRTALELLPKEAINQTSENGYFRLAYHPLNYAASCKPCNSAIKSNYFPTLGARRINEEHPNTLRDEVPLLIYPIGDVDEDDPEKLITFRGIVAMAGAPKSDRIRHLRGKATVMFFHLNRGDGRENLARERARVIDQIMGNLRTMNYSKSASVIATCRKTVQAAVNESAPHASCARNFLRLFDADHAEAEAVWLESVEYLHSHATEK